MMAVPRKSFSGSARACVVVCRLDCLGACTCRGSGKIDRFSVEVLKPGQTEHVADRSGPAFLQEPARAKRECQNVNELP